MHNRSKTGAGCSLSWEDKIRERGSEEGRSTPMLPNRRPPMPGHSPATTPPLLPTAFSFYPSSRAFNFKGNDKQRTSLYKEVESQQGSEWSEYGTRKDYAKDSLGLFEVFSYLKQDHNDFFLPIINSNTLKQWSLCHMIARSTLCNQHYSGFSMPAQICLSAIKELIVPGVLHVIQAHLSLPGIESL